MGATLAIALLAGARSCDALSLPWRSRTSQDREAANKAGALTRHLEPIAGEGATPFAKYCGEQVYSCQLDPACVTCYEGFIAQGGQIPQPDKLTCPNLLLEFSKVRC